MVESFKQVFDEMSERNRLCWNVTISRYLRCRRFEEALDVFRGCYVRATRSLMKLRLFGEAREVFYGYRLLFTGCARLGALEQEEWIRRNGKTSKAIEFFLKMVQIDMKPDDFTFIVVLSACVHRGLVDEGREFFNSMRKIYERLRRRPKKSKYDANNLVPQENMNICKA
ncbi:hypothetical protein ACFX2C_017728 [Malus domestica]